MSALHPLPAEQSDPGVPRRVRLSPSIEVIVPPEVRSVWLDPDGATIRFEACLREGQNVVPPLVVTTTRARL